MDTTSDNNRFRSFFQANSAAAPLLRAVCPRRLAAIEEDSPRRATFSDGRCPRMETGPSAATSPCLDPGHPAATRKRISCLGQGNAAGQSCPVSATALMTIGAAPQGSPPRASCTHGKSFPILSPHCIHRKTVPRALTPMPTGPINLAKTPQVVANTPIMRS